MHYMGGKFRISTELANLLNIYIYIYMRSLSSAFLRCVQHRKQD